MGPIGFSTGALAKGDFRRGLELQDAQETTAVELSALREDELQPLVEELSSLALSRFQYISVHAPSRLTSRSEDWLISLLHRVPGEWPIVAHPDLIREVDAWRTLGWRLCLENMDIRKPTGRTADELDETFALLPEAGFCFDIGHARQIDPTMTVAVEMLQRFGDRLRQLHVSEVGTFGEHRAIGYLARLSYRSVARFVPSDVPIILESIVPPERIQRELELARELFAA